MRTIRFIDQLSVATTTHGWYDIIKLHYMADPDNVKYVLHIKETNKYYTKYNFANFTNPEIYDAKNGVLIRFGITEINETGTEDSILLHIFPFALNERFY